MVNKFKIREYEDMRHDDITQVNKKYGAIGVSKEDMHKLEQFINEVYDFAFEKGKTFK